MPRPGAEGSHGRPGQADRQAVARREVELAAWIERRGAMSAEAIARARARQALYGGSFETVLLETEALDEPTLARLIAEVTGLPVAERTRLERLSATASRLADLPTARRLQAVPVGLEGDQIELVGGLAVDLEGVARWGEAQDRATAVFVTTEVRLVALLARAYGAPIPPRLASLVGRLLGAAAARRWVGRAPLLRPPRAPRVGGAPTGGAPAQPRADAPAALPALDELDIQIEEADASEAQTAPPPPRPERAAQPQRREVEAEGGARAAAPETPPPPAPFPPSGYTEREIEQLVADARLEARSERRRTALRTLRDVPAHPRVRALADRLRADAEGSGTRARLAIEALGALADPAAVPVLIDRVDDRDEALAAAAHAALVDITRQDFGRTRRRWGRWWGKARRRERIEWLLDALSHPAEELRLAASEELQRLSGGYFGYHFDLPARERAEARRRLLAWWRSRPSADRRG